MTASSNCGRRKSFGPVERAQGRGPDGLPGQGHRARRRQRRRQVDPHQGARRSAAVRRRARSSSTASPVDLHTPRDAARLGIEVVYQDLALCDNLDIVQNMFLGREETRVGMLDEGRMEKRRVRHAARPVGAHREVGAAEGLVALRRPAPDRRDRPRRAEEGHGGHPRRADRRARRRADRAGAEPGQAARRAGRRA